MAQAFELRQVENPYEKFYLVNKMPVGAPQPLTRFVIARGEQKVIAYWMHNDSTTATVDVEIDINNIVETFDTFPGDGFEARVLTTRDRVVFGGHETGDPQWSDVDNDATFDREDIEAIFDYEWDSTDIPATELHPMHEWRHATSDTNQSAVVKLYKDPEPLPLYGAYDLKDDYTITLAPDEARVLWLVVTVPDDMTTGTYQASLTTPGGNGPVYLTVDDGQQSDVIDLPLAITVPCWDALDIQESALWDYSYIPGTPTPEFSGVLLPGDTANERARIRTIGGHNTLPIYIGHPSRTPDETGTIITQFRWILSGLHYELLRYEDDPSNPEHIDTIILLMSLNAVTLDGDWGTDPTAPDSNGDWERRYRQTLIDFETEMEATWPGRNIDLSNYNIVIMPVDEPGSYIDDPGCTYNPGVEDNICTNVNPGGRECWEQHMVKMVSTEVTRRDLFRASARVIKDLPATVAKNRWTLVNHNRPELTRCDELITQFDKCGPSHSDCVDIWMSAGLMQDAIPVAHPFNDGSNTPWADPVGDQFWWYHFDGYEGADEGPMRYAQSGLVMADLGYSGHGNWAFWAAEQQLDSADEQWVADTTTVYNRHSWVSTNVRLWGQDNNVYLSPNTVDSSYFPNPDTTAPADTPTSEAFIPGRVVLARRQAMEYQRLLDKLEDGPLTMTPAASTLVEDIRQDAIHPCHSDGNCTVQASPEEWSLVVHQWLNQAAYNVDSCTTTPIRYYGTQTDIEAAFDIIDPWSN